MRRLAALLALLLAAPLVAQSPGAAYKLDQVAVRLDGGAGGSGFSTPSGCVATSVPIFLGSPVALGCDAGLAYDSGTDTLTVGRVLVGDGSAAAPSSVFAAEAGTGFWRYTTGILGISLSGTVQSLYATGTNPVWLFRSTNVIAWSGGDPTTVGADTGLRRVSPGLVGVTSGGSNLGSLQAGNVTAVALGTPTITSPLTVNGTPGSTTYGYKAVAFLNDGTSSAASPEVTIATGPAALGATDNITVAWPAVTGQAYSNLYRTTGGTAPPKLIYSGTAPTFIDTGTEISASTPPTTNTTGRILAGDGSAAAPSVAFASEPGTGFMRASQNNIKFRMEGTDFLGLNGWGLFLAGDSYSLYGGAAADWGIGRYAAGVGKALAGPNPATNGSWAAVHYIGIGTAPTVTGDGTTNGSVVGSDFAARITVGTGTTTTITLAFGTAFTNAPACVVNAATTATPINVSTTVSAATLTTTAFTAGEVLHVMCGGF